MPPKKPVQEEVVLEDTVCKYIYLFKIMKSLPNNEL
jgi:hypothetical protein